MSQGVDSRNYRAYLGNESLRYDVSSERGKKAGKRG